MNYFITAIGTDSGKTIVSAIFAEALGAGYWKPIQAGYPTDTDAIKQLISNPSTSFFEEAYLLNTPSSPHAAAKLEGVKINLKEIVLPDTASDLIIEGAGGIMVPINEQELVINLTQQFDCEIILVCNLYLGSINHSLLSIDYLKTHQYKLTGIVFNGKSNPESERIILQHAKAPCLLKVDQEQDMNKDRVKYYAGILKQNLVNERIIK